MNDKKRARVAKVGAARQLKRMQATNALAVAALRAASARSVLKDEIVAAKAEGMTFEDEGTFNAGHMAAMQQLVVNRPARMASMITLFYASLNVVIEGWRDKRQPIPRLRDVQIDALLASEFPKLLAGFRNAMLHPNPLDDRRLVHLSASPGMGKWADQLCGEFVRFFQDWRRSLAPGSEGQHA